MLFICFAAYNEKDNIENLLRRLHATLAAAGPYQVVAFNDGSTDDTLAELERLRPHYPLTVIHSPQNVGLGGGTQRLLEHVCEVGDPSDIAVFMDGDDTHDPASIAGMCASIARGADVVIASRYQPGAVISGIPWRRQVLSRGASLFWQLMLPLKNVRDYSCGYRAYRVGLLMQAKAERHAPFITRRGFECQVELLHALRPYARFTEVPIRLAYDRKLGESKMRVLRTSMRTLSLGIHLLTDRCLGTKSG